MSIRTFTRAALRDLDRLGAGMEIAFPRPMTFTATGSALTWAATGWSWPVAVAGLVLTCAVRLRLNPAVWGERSVRARQTRAYFAPERPVEVSRD